MDERIWVSGPMGTHPLIGQAPILAWMDSITRCASLQALRVWEGPA